MHRVSDNLFETREQLGNITVPLKLLQGSWLPSVPCKSLYFRLGYTHNPRVGWFKSTPAPSKSGFSVHMGTGYMGNTFGRSSLQSPNSSYFVASVACSSVSKNVYQAVAPLTSTVFRGNLDCLPCVHSGRQRYSGVKAESVEANCDHFTTPYRSIQHHEGKQIARWG